MRRMHAARKLEPSDQPKLEEGPAMKKTIVGLALAALLVAAAPAGAATGVKYKGKTSSGHPITFTLKGKRLYEMRSGIRVSCI